MKDYRTYIFDLDGTLLDTLKDLAASTNYALSSYGMPERSIEEVRQFVGNGIRKLIERAVPAGTEAPLSDKIFSAFRKHYLDHDLVTTKPYQGIEETLRELKKRGKHLAIVSNKIYTATQELVHHFFPDTINVAIGEKEGIRRKPAPDTVNEALRQLGISSRGAVYIGDSDVDIMTARNCGIPCISVLWGFRDREFLMEHGAETFISSPKELLY